MTQQPTGSAGGKVPQVRQYFILTAPAFAQIAKPLPAQSAFDHTCMQARLSDRAILDDQPLRNWRAAICHKRCHQRLQADSQILSWLRADFESHSVKHADISLHLRRHVSGVGS
jgi:hypothetical protein